MKTLIAKNSSALEDNSKKSLEHYFNEIESNLEFAPKLAQELSNSCKLFKSEDIPFYLKYYLASKIEEVGFVDDLVTVISDQASDQFSEEQEEFFDYINSTEFGATFKEFSKDNNFKTSAIMTLNVMKRALEETAQSRLENRESKYQVLEFGEKSKYKFSIGGIDFYCEEESWKERLELAIKFLERHAPTSYELFDELTHTVIAVDDPGIVSYSSQILPGISVINFKERNLNNLVDDLVHENSHHFLNHLLNQDEYIIEDDDNCFYSPWRRAFRPIRGVYHGVSTFAFGHFVFLEILQSDFSENPFSREFFLERFCEEHIMLTFCKNQLISDFSKEKITERGREYLAEIYLYIDSCEDIFEKYLQQLSKDSLQNIERLKQHLTQIKTQYSLS